MKILFTSSEAAPFIKTGGLGDVAGALPKTLVGQGHDVRVVLPYYSDIAEAYKNTMSYVGNFFVPLAWRSLYAGVFCQTIDGVKYYFIDNEYYFKRKGLYGHYDDAERFAFFSRAVLEMIPHVDFFPDIIHCNDWHTALVPVFLDTLYRDREGFGSIKTVFTIHNIQFQGKYGKELFADVLGLPEDKEELVTYGECLNFMKGAIECANVVTTVSESYAKEILDPYYSYGLDGILKERTYKLRGVVNGIDVQTFNPMTDKALFKNYNTVSSKSGKAANKEGLCQMLGLPYSDKKPLIAMITRLTGQKGIDILMNVIDDILDRDLQLVVLGTGDWQFETALVEAEKHHPGNFRALITFSGDLANKLYAGSDMFLMPSRFEPCGLSQLISMRYGSVPIVRETGGLRDTVTPFNPATGEGTGYTFYSYNAHDMLGAIDRAIGDYHGNRTGFNKLVRNAMKEDFSWNKSAKRYAEIYKSI